MPSLLELSAKAKKKLLQNRTAQRLAVSFGRELEPRRWIFLLGCYNSGTTLLRSLLARHPDIATLPSEGVRLTDVLPRPEEYHWPRMWCRSIRHVRISNGPEEARRASRIKKHWSLFYPPQAENLLEKSIANAARIPFLEAHFRPAYFIYLVRDGYAVAEGIRRKAKPGLRSNPIYLEEYPIGLCAEQWRETDRLVQQDGKGVAHFMQMSYEDFSADPAAAAGRLTDFLELPPLDPALFGENWTVHGVDGPIRNMNESSLARLSAEDIDKIHQVAGVQLEAHGYARPTPGPQSAT
jgi:hypothetical protein